MSPSWTRKLQSQAPRRLPNATYQPPRKPYPDKVGGTRGHCARVRASAYPPAVSLDHSRQFRWTTAGSFAGRSAAFLDISLRGLSGHPELGKGRGDRSCAFEVSSSSICGTLTPCRTRSCSRGPSTSRTPLSGPRRRRRRSERCRCTPIPPPTRCSVTKKPNCRAGWRQRTPDRRVVPHAYDEHALICG
jgi:hypothetical protein